MGKSGNEKLNKEENFPCLLFHECTLTIRCILKCGRQGVVCTHVYRGQWPVTQRREGGAETTLTHTVS